jgi:hypothetical protein
MRIAEHSGRADKSAVGAINRPLRVSGDHVTGKYAANPPAYIGKPRGANRQFLRQMGLRRQGRRLRGVSIAQHSPGLWWPRSGGGQEVMARVC